MAPLLVALTVALVITLGGSFAYFFIRQRRRNFAAADITAPSQPAALVRPAALTQEPRPAPAPGRPTDLARVSCLTMREAEDLLDWLEQHGYPDRAVHCEADSFLVEFRVDAGHVKSGPHQVTHTAQVVGESRVDHGERE